MSFAVNALYDNTNAAVVSTHQLVCGVSPERGVVKYTILPAQEEVVARQTAVFLTVSWTLAAE